MTKQTVVGKDFYGNLVRTGDTVKIITAGGNTNLSHLNPKSPDEIREDQWITGMVVLSNFCIYVVSEDIKILQATYGANKNWFSMENCKLIVKI